MMYMRARQSQITCLTRVQGTMRLLAAPCGARGWGAARARASRWGHPAPRALDPRVRCHHQLHMRRHRFAMSPWWRMAHGEQIGSDSAYRLYEVVVGDEGGSVGAGNPVGEWRPLLLP